MAEKSGREKPSYSKWPHFKWSWCPRTLPSYSTGGIEGVAFQAGSDERSDDRRSSAVTQRAVRPKTNRKQAKTGEGGRRQIINRIKYLFALSSKVLFKGCSLERTVFTTIVLSRITVIL